VNEFKKEIKADTKEWKVSRIVHAFLGSSKMKFRRLIALISDDVLFLLFLRGRRLI
jgi:hypothetical protein